MPHIDLQILLDWISRIVTIASIVLMLMRWSEGAIEIWYPRTPQNRFWLFYDKFTQTIQYISISPQKRLQDLEGKSDENTHTSS